MCIVYGLNYLDKTTLSYASIMGLRLPPSDNKLASGIGLVGDQYSWLGSMFYFGYIAFEYPTTRLLQVLPLGKYCMSLSSLLPWNLRGRKLDLANMISKLHSTSSCGALYYPASPQLKITPARSPLDFFSVSSNQQLHLVSHSSHRNGIPRRNRVHVPVSGSVSTALRKYSADVLLMALLSAVGSRALLWSRGR